MEKAGRFWTYGQGKIVTGITHATAHPVDNANDLSIFDQDVVYGEIAMYKRYRYRPWTMLAQFCQLRSTPVHRIVMQVVLCLLKHMIEPVGMITWKSLRGRGTMNSGQNAPERS